MDTSSHLRDVYSTGPLLTVKPLKGRKGRPRKAHVIAAKIAEYWLNDPKNKSIISSPWLESVLYGMGIGMNTGIGSLLKVPASEYYVNRATKKKQEKKTRRDGNARPNKNARVRRSRSDA
jgi:hypothetical protein